jgi:hypothetical protein
LVAITGVIFALITAVRYTISGADFAGALMQGLLWGVVIGVVSIIIYQVFKSSVLKA